MWHEFRTFEAWVQDIKLLMCKLHAFYGCDNGNGNNRGFAERRITRRPPPSMRASHTGGAPTVRRSEPRRANNKPGNRD